MRCIALVWAQVFQEVYACCIKAKGAGVCQGSVHGHS